MLPGLARWLAVCRPAGRSRLPTSGLARVPALAVRLPLPLAATGGAGIMAGAAEQHD